MNWTKAGAFMSTFGLAIFGIPAALAIGEVQIPKALTLSCMVAGLMISGAGHSLTGVFAAKKDDAQQVSIEDLKQQMAGNTDFIRKLSGGGTTSDRPPTNPPKP